MENPELYAVFPYSLYGVGKPGIDMGIRTFERRVNKEGDCWKQDAIQAACLGLAEEARNHTVKKFTLSIEECRFPAFWGPNNDWIPDQDQGGVGAMSLQSMILQAEGKSIYLFPSWPNDWDVEFKLHAPHMESGESEFDADSLAFYIRELSLSSSSFWLIISSVYV
ncbi:MAG: hypothetical protein J7639_31770 [Paenibacillaceae bacterium]|nr:hypothetical protein [Paenibacillaceae bacterium]